MSLAPSAFFWLEVEIELVLQIIPLWPGVLVGGKKGSLKQIYVELLCLAAEPTS